MASARNRQPKTPDAKAKCKTGRPTSYRKRFVQLGYNYSLLGATDVEMAEFFGVHVATLNDWKIAHPEFHESIKKGKAVADAAVANKLFARAMGTVRQKTVKIFSFEGGSFEHPYYEVYPPDVTAQIFWLKNRQPHLWRDRHHVDHSGRVDGAGGKPVEEMTAGEIDAELARRGALDAHREKETPAV